MVAYVEALIASSSFENVGDGRGCHTLVHMHRINTKLLSTIVFHVQIYIRIPRSHVDRNGPLILNFKFEFASALHLKLHIRRTRSTVVGL